MRVRLLYPVANDPAGAVITLDPRRADRLVRTGYAVVVESVEPVKKKKDEPRWPLKDS